jgi:hypothetical protein
MEMLAKKPDVRSTSGREAKGKEAMIPLTFTNQVAITVFVPLAVAAFFSFLSIVISGGNATKNAQRQNDLTAKMKLADFRQAWINELRDCFSELQSLGITPSPDPTEIREVHRLATKIRLHMNRNDPNYRNLDKLIDRLITNADRDDKLQIVQEMTQLCQDILKAEWKVLKRDLNYDAPVGGVAADPLLKSALGHNEKRRGQK